MQADFPHVEVAGTHSPPFRPEPSRDDTEEMIERVNASGADVLWVGMTAPKQEKWIHDNRHRLDVSFAGPIGAVFDFYAGNVRRAGPAWQRLGLEWLPRLVQEPRRLWRRNLVSTPAFLFRTVRHQLSGARAKGVD
jgi:N-acetylglucosaminyldiphosphoundecaprenol N-acetyl-beta-D-mannosaminyltransferase